MKTWKLVSGIISIIMSAFILFQSCAAGIGNTLSENGETSGSIGFLVAILLLVVGIVSIVVRSSEKKWREHRDNYHVCFGRNFRIHDGRKLC